MANVGAEAVQVVLPALVEVADVEGVSAVGEFILDLQPYVQTGDINTQKEQFVVGGDEDVI